MSKALAKQALRGRAYSTHLHPTIGTASANAKISHLKPIFLRSGVGHNDGPSALELWHHRFAGFLVAVVEVVEVPNQPRQGFFNDGFEAGVVLGSMEIGKFRCDFGKVWLSNLPAHPKAVNKRAPSGHFTEPILVDLIFPVADRETHRVRIDADELAQKVLPSPLI